MSPKMLDVLTMMAAGGQIKYKITKRFTTEIELTNTQKVHPNTFWRLLWDDLIELTSHEYPIWLYTITLKGREVLS